MTTKHELQIDLQVLNAAREHIEFCRYRFVCNAIEKASIQLTGSDASSDRLRAWIQSMLGHSQSLESWLRKNGHASKKDVNASFVDPVLKGKIRATRTAWLDWMISECERDYERQ
jgi:hypothetical protein